MRVRSMRTQDRCDQTGHEGQSFKGQERKRDPIHSHAGEAEGLLFRRSTVHHASRFLQSLTVQVSHNLLLLHVAPKGIPKFVPNDEVFVSRESSEFIDADRLAAAVGKRKENLLRRGRISGAIAPLMLQVRVSDPHWHRGQRCAQLHRIAPLARLPEIERRPGSRRFQVFFYGSFDSGAVDFDFKAQLLMVMRHEIPHRFRH